MHANKSSSYYNVSKAIHYLEIAIEHNHYEAASQLANIYIKIMKDYNKGLEYLDLAFLKSKDPQTKLNLIADYLNDRSILGDFLKGKRIYKSIKDLQELNEMEEWYNLGYEKYTTGHHSKALLIFSFAALHGHVKSMKSAAYMWDKGLTGGFTCRLGHNQMCAFVYYMQLFLFKNKIEYSTKAALSLQKLQDENIDLGANQHAIDTLSNKLSMKLYEINGNSGDFEAEFRKAQMYYYQKVGDSSDISEKKTNWKKAKDIFDRIAFENGVKGFLPAFLMS